MSQKQTRHNRKSVRSRRLLPSFTLVELLIAITIIGIMVGMVLYTLAGARRDSLTARTRGTIKKLNEIVLARWEEFRYRAIKVNVPDDVLVPSVDLGAGNPMMAPLSPREGARLRMIILRDVMRMEFPDRFTDITTSPCFYKAALYTGDNSPPYANTAVDTPMLLDRTVPSLYNTFRRKLGLGAFTGSMGATVGISVTTPPATGFPSQTLQSAELLYMIVANTSHNGANGLEFFRPSEIADTDDDGFPEFVDAWGKPILWLRWPAGYGVVNSTTMTASQIANSIPPDAGMNDRSVPDPLDPLHTDWRWSHPGFSGVSKPWMLIPLIVSAGPDGEYDVHFDDPPPAQVNYGLHVWTLGGTGSPAHATGLPYSFPDPYVFYYDTSGPAAVEGAGGMGHWVDADGDPDTFGAQDNITNYGLLLE